MNKQCKVISFGNKKVRKQESIYFMSKREMNQVMKKYSKIVVVGGTRLKKVTEGNEYKADFLIELPFSDCKNKNEFYLGKVKEKGFLKGYFQLNEHEFIEYRSWNFLFVIFLGVLFLSCLIFFVIGDWEATCFTQKEHADFVVEDEDNWNGVIHQEGNVNDFEDDRIEIPGYHELYVTESEPSIVLGNPNGNTVLFKYEIMKEDILIYETGYIKPANKVNWDAYHDLSNGDHALTFVVSTIDESEYFPCNGATLSVIIHVK